MIEESLRIQVQGYLLHRMVIQPASDMPVRASAIFYHGQGDYAERYGEILQPFTRCGIRCIITELPGHGLSPGRRGHSGDVELLDAIIANTLEFMKVQDGGVYGVMGHSMGGLLAARHLVLAGLGRLPIPAFSWLSSPLIHPGHGRSDWLLGMVRLLGFWFAPLTVSTGVTPAMCRVKQDAENDSPGEGQDEVSPKHQLWHNRISVGWGAALLDMEQLVCKELGQIPQDISLIYTQGGGDPICPPELAREWFEKLPNEKKQYHEFEGLMHEPFRGDESERLFKVLEDWLDTLPLPCFPSISAE